MSQYDNEQCNKESYSENSQQWHQNQYDDPQMDQQTTHHQQFDPQYQLPEHISSSPFFHVPQRPIQPKTPKMDFKYKVQCLGMMITAACAAFCCYSLYESGMEVYKEYLFGFFDNFVGMAGQFPTLFAYLLASYFFIKALIVPSYTAGANLSKKYWPLSVTEQFIRLMVSYEIFSIAMQFHRYIANYTITWDMMYYVLKRIYYVPLLRVAIQYFVFDRYLKVSLYGDKGCFAFLKPWIVDEEGEEDQMSTKI